MLSTDDTIVAVATPPGRGGVSLARLSGPAAHAIALGVAGRTRHLVARRATRSTLRGIDVPDDALLTFFPGPASYTGQDVVEISTHGSPVVMASVLATATAHGARAAQPGEFTLRAFLSGRLDLVQAEAVQALVDAVSPAQARAAARHLDGTLSAAIGRLAATIADLHLRLEASMDFPDEGYRFVDRARVRDALHALRDELHRLAGTDGAARRLREGHVVVVAGAPNVGKSSVFNALVGVDRAIVTPVPGTTRDLIAEQVLFGGAHVQLVDTAGVRESADAVEQEGIRRAESTAVAADLVIVVLDGSRPVSDDDRRVLSATAAQARLIVANKCDLTPAWEVAAHGVELTVSATRGIRTDDLAKSIAARLATMVAPDDGLVTSERQRARLREAHDHLAHACASLDELGDVPEEFLAADLLRAHGALDEMTGARAPDDVLAEIFSRFCIGK